MLEMVLCPWHPEEKPSLGIYDDGHVHCFSCGAHRSRLEYLIAVHGSLGRAMVALVGGTARYGVKPARPMDLGPELTWPECPPELLAGIRVSRPFLQTLGAKVYTWCLGFPLDLVGPTISLPETWWVYRKPAAPKYLYQRGMPAGSKVGLIPGAPVGGIVVEGVLDAWRLAELGWIGDIYILLGTNCNEAKIRVLQAAAQPLYWMLDNDEPGRRAEEVLQETVGGRRISYEGEDPQTLDALPSALPTSNGVIL